MDIGCSSLVGSSWFNFENTLRLYFGNVVENILWNSCDSRVIIRMLSNIVVKVLVRETKAIDLDECILYSE